MIKDLTNKTLMDPSGKILKPFKLPKTNFTIVGKNFPNYNNVENYNSGVITIKSSVANTIYADFNDGSAVYEMDFVGVLELRTNNPIYTYKSSGRHIVSIWFKIPTKITSIAISLCTMFGDFPIGLSFYPLDDLSLNRLGNIEHFPIDYGASILNRLLIDDVTKDVQKNIPLWMIKSSINHLLLGGGFEFGDLNNLDQLINVKNLESLTFRRRNNVVNIPSNYKEIKTLKRLNFGTGNPVRSITQEVNNCKQLEVLAWGYSTNTNISNTSVDGMINSWGYGVTNMPNLIELSLNGCYDLPTTAITGIETAIKLKRIRMRDSYKTQQDLDSIIVSQYSSANNSASKENGNTLLRQVLFEICWIASNSRNVFRPTGVFKAPVGYIKGSSNGIPSTPMEMLYVLSNQYHWTILINNNSLTGIETLTP